MSTESPEQLTFSGSSSENVTVFLRDVKRVAVAQGHQRDDAWILDFVEGCLTDDAFRWFVGLDEDATDSWAALRKAFLERFGQVSHAPPSNVPAAAPSAPLPAAAGPPPAPSVNRPPLPGTLPDSITGLMVDKVLIVGDSGVGKTCLLSRYMCQGWPGTAVQPTDGVSYQTWTIYSAQAEFHLRDHYWEISGSLPQNIASQYIPNTHSVWLVYDVTSRASFTRLQSDLVPLVNRYHRGPSPTKVLIANKCDLPERRVVEEHEGRRFASQQGMRYYEVSAKTNEGFFELRANWVPSFAKTS